MDLILQRLKTMYNDIFDSENQLKTKTKLLEMSLNPDNRINEIYVKDHVPCSVGGYNNRIQKTVDMDSVYIKFSMGYDEFVGNLKKEIEEIKAVRDSALILFSYVFQLEPQESEILFFRYYIGLSVADIQKMFYIGRSSYYRIIDRSVAKIKKLMKEDSLKKSNDKARISYSLSKIEQNQLQNSPKATKKRKLS